ncbi:MAG: type II CAAX endopeptidase family protein [Synechococcus sp. cluster2_bin.209]|nr:type II CAAX endopeptidase family protein [Synechococcus sp. cluster2_bin.209]
MSSSSRQVSPRWKVFLAAISLLLAGAIWLSGLVDSLSRPSVSPSLTLQQQELSLLAQPAVPSSLQPVLLGEDPRDALLQALEGSAPADRNDRQQLLLELLRSDQEPPVVENRWLADPLIRRLICERQPSSVDGCVDADVASAAAWRLAVSGLLPLLTVLVGSLLLLVQIVRALRGRLQPWPVVDGPALSLIDVVLLVAGGFVVISAVGVSLVALPLVSSFTAGLESPRREAVTVVINYSVMALPSLFILWRQLKALPRADAPKGGWLQWRWQPWPGAISSAVGGWLMVTPVVVATGWLLVRLVGDPGGSNPLLELVLGSQDPLALFLLGLTAVVLAPLFEETIFRGALLPVLAKRWGTAGGVVLSALLFAMAHISIGELAPLTVLGIGLALVRVSTGRLLPSVLMHALWNAVTFLNLLVL